MSKLMRDETHKRALTGQNRRRRECECRVFHSTERKRRRQHEDVVPPPSISAIQLFGSGDHLVHLTKLTGRTLDYRRLGVDAGVLADWTKCNVTDGKSNQIWRNGMRQRETEDTSTLRVFLAF